MNLLESGLVRDLGIRKVLAVLDKLELSLAVEPVERHRRRDYIRMACTSASVSFKNTLAENELVHALVAGKVPPGRDAHFITLFDEAPVELLRGLAEEAGRWTRPGKLQRNMERLARDVDAQRGIEA